ncbi:hypothetical protein D3C71_1369580 [compost metagenome]
MPVARVFKYPFVPVAVKFTVPPMVVEGVAARLLNDCSSTLGASELSLLHDAVMPIAAIPKAIDKVLNLIFISFS